MPIEPIQIGPLARNPVGIESILARGSSAFQSILSNAIQIGRDQANNQLRQERDLITEQRREINLDQRKREEAQQNFEDERRFDEDRRQFGIKFDEDVRQFDTRVDESTLDRGVRSRSLDIREDQGERTLDLSERRVGVAEDELDLRREEADADKPYDAAKLREAIARADTAENDRDREKADTELERTRRHSQARVLNELNRLLEAGRKEDARSYYRRYIEHPDLKFSDSSKARFARQVGIDPQLGTSRSSGSGDGTPIESMSLAQIEAELETLREASDVKASREVSEKMATRMAALRRRQAALEKGTAEGRKEIAERLRARGRSAP